MYGFIRDFGLNLGLFLLGALMVYGVIYAAESAYKWFKYACYYSCYMINYHHPLINSVAGIGLCVIRCTSNVIVNEVGLHIIVNY